MTGRIRPVHAGRPLGRNRTTRAAAALVAASFVLFAGAHAASASTPDEGNVSVEVTDGVETTPTPTPTPTRGGQTPTPSSTPVAPPVNPGLPQAPVASQVVQATILDPEAADEALGEEAAAVEGGLAMSGLSADAGPSFDLGNGTLTLSFVVRNNTNDPIDSSARFWVDNALGFRLADVTNVLVEDLEPDETRRVLVRIDGLGQHIVLRNYVTLTPLGLVDGEPLPTMTRNVTLAVPPLFSLSLVSAIGALSGLVWWAISSRGLGLRLRRFGL